MKKTTATYFVSDLLNCKLITPEGKLLGHVADIQLTRAPEYKVVGLIYGLRGWLYRLHALNPFRQSNDQSPQLYMLPWDAVESFEHSVIKLKPGYEVIEEIKQPIF